MHRLNGFTMLTVITMTILAAGAAAISAPAGAVPSPREAAYADPPQPAPASTDRPMTAAFLVVDGVYNSELMAPYDILHHTRFHAPTGRHIEVFTVSPAGAIVTTFEGIRIAPHHSFETAPPIDILVVPSAEGSMDRDLRDEKMMAWVRRVGGKARFVMSLCDGAFVLASAGLLEGRAATTFPGDQDRFAQQFPTLSLRREPSFVHDGPALTSHGGAKSYDVAMYLVAHLYGDTVAARVGAGLLIPWPPAPGSPSSGWVAPAR